ncbi:MAG: sodium/proton-translocating pyrophosphatase, partial [Myxococcota bacterium]|nr:sodium/proton-translocating pyrophosphatase [Myxococcota bacterium]
MSMDQITYLVPAVGVLALIYALIKAQWVKKQDAGSTEMQEIARRIQEGAMAFLGREYKVLALFVAVVAGLLAFANMGGADDLARSPLIA